MNTLFSTNSREPTMDSISINALKGYDKLNPAETQPATTTAATLPARRRPLTLALTLTISSIVILTLTLAFLIGALIHESLTEPHDDESSSSLRSDPPQSIRAVCNFTQHPDSCFAAISSLNSSVQPDPLSIFQLSLQACVNEASNASLFVKDSAAKSSNGGGDGTAGAIGDCVGQLDDAVSQLGDSLTAAKSALTDTKVNDIQTWVSAALTDHETCLDGLEEVGSAAAVVDQVRARLASSKEMMSNALAICANMGEILKRFGMSMH